jgi:hypothetical protein
MAKKKTAPRKSAKKRASLKAAAARSKQARGPFHPFITAGITLVDGGLRRLKRAKRLGKMR